VVSGRGRFKFADRPSQIAPALRRKARPRAYAHDVSTATLGSVVPTKHPLDVAGLAYARSKRDAAAAASAPAKAAFDPLGAKSDPLGAHGPRASASASASSGPSSHVAGADDGRDRYTEMNWPAVRKKILAQFTITGRIVLESNLFVDADEIEAPDERSMSLELAKQRMKELDAAKEATPTEEISQRDYQHRIEVMHKRLDDAWTQGQRVLALKIAIQCAKLISQPRSLPQFYPSMFVMCSGILDTFGKRVFDRLRHKADQTSRKMGAGPLPHDFTAADVDAGTRETTRNWLYKTACIRELVPRLYIELALLESYRFLGTSDVADLLTRLAHTCRGIGDPLVAAYARFYLAKQAARLVSGEKERACVWLCLQDQLTTWADTESEHRISTLARQDVAPDEYAELFRPPINWLVRQVAWRAPVGVFGKVIRLYRDKCASPIVLTAILDSFEGVHYSHHIREIVPLIKATADKPAQQPMADLYRAAATGLAAHEPLEEDKLPFLADAWSAVAKIEEPEAYVRCAAPFVDLLRKHFSESDLLIVLRAIAKRMRKIAKETGAKRAAEAAAAASASGDAAVAAASSAARVVPPECLNHLESILVSIVSGGNRADNGDITGPSPAVITSDAFVSLLDLFAGPPRTAVCRRMLEAFVEAGEPTSDPVLVHTLMDVARSVHDSVDAFSPHQVIKATAELCSRLVELADFGRDLERQLQLLADARQSFRRLEATRLRVCLAAVQLTRRARAFVKGRHKAKTAEFMRAAFAFLHVSIPSISDYHHRMALFVAAAESALCNDCVPQAESLYEAAITEIAEAGASAAGFGGGGRSSESSSEQAVEEAIGRLAGSLVMAPGHPEKGPFYLLRRLSDETRRFPWDPLRGGKARSLITVLEALVATGQTTLLYRPGPGGAEANDSLYAGDPEFEDEHRDFVNDLSEEVLAAVTDLSELTKEAGDSSPVGVVFRDVAMRFVDFACAHFDMAVPEAVSTMVKMFKLAKRRGVDASRLEATARYLEWRMKNLEEDNSPSWLPSHREAFTDGLSKVLRTAAVAAGVKTAWGGADEASA
jgi:hypothetical protein